MTFHNSQNIGVVVMRDSHRLKLEEIDANSITVEFSRAVKSTLVALDSAVDSSEHFDEDARAILHSWATGKAPSLSEVMVGMPLIAGEIFQHIRICGDERAEKAWEELCSRLLEQGFKLSRRKQHR
jgi:hypothetical protein